MKAYYSICSWIDSAVSISNKFLSFFYKKKSCTHLHLLLMFLPKLLLGELNMDLKHHTNLKTSPNTIFYKKLYQDKK